jgi:outer membrane protein assembly factor BamB
MLRSSASLVLLLMLPWAAVAQVGSPTPVSPGACRAAGLERMWFTQVGLDRGRGRLAGVFMHVSAVDIHTVLQITHDNKRFVFSQRDRDAFGKEIGLEGARQAAEAKVEEIKKALIDAGKTDAAAPAIESFVVPQTTIYATSERGGLHALDGETGRTLWSVTVGNPLYPTTAPAANEKYVGFCNGSTLYVLKTADGSMAWNRPMVGSPGAGPAFTEEMVFVAMIGGQVETRLLEQPRHPAGLYKSFGRTMIQPVTSTNSVAWATDKGNLYVGLAHAPGIRFRMTATDAIEAAPAFLAPDKIFATSIDGYIYCIGENKGNILWRFSTGEPIAHSPIALGETVYAISSRGNMYAIDVVTAMERWITGGIDRYLAGNEKRLYCLDKRGNLTIIDAASGSRVGGIAAVPTDMAFLNRQTDRILLVSSTGLLQCLREASLPFPVVHYTIEPQQKTTVTLPKAGQKPAEKSDPPTTDPFGAPSDRPAAPGAGGDPFGAPASPTAPPPAAGDPFANP